ncbi:MAG: 16S rRNA (guanine(966)-N(2))-methyltransferase RsmD [Acetivibrionales bacterium]
MSGTAKGHKLKTLKGLSTRPTSDKVKEALFNIVSQYVKGADVLDLFAGTGNLGIEALSRGASSAVLVDKSMECHNIIKQNLIHTKLMDRAEILTGDVIRVLLKLAGEGRSFDIVFMDPPYCKNFAKDTLQIVSDNGIIKNDGIVVIERDIKDEIPQEVGRLRLLRDGKYGNTVLSFYKIGNGHE